MPEKRTQKRDGGQTPRRTGSSVARPPKKKTVKKMKSEAQVRREQERRKKITTNLTAITVFFILFYFALALIIASYVFFSYITYGEDEKEYTFCTGYYYLNSNSEVRFYRESKSSVYFGGVQYVPVSQISKLTDFVLTGDGDEFSLFFDDKNKAELCSGSQIIKINGESRTLTHPAVKSNNEYYVPLEFIKNSFLGVEFTENSKNFIYEVQKNELYSTIQLINVSNEPMIKPTVR